MMWLIMASFIPFTNCDKVSLCRQAKDCATCATSYTYTFGLREQCRWCVYVKQCLGPLSCPFGKAIVERDPSRCPKKVTGYSVGGSLASMTALYLAKNELVNKALIRLVTFGEPRTGNVAFARAVEKYIRFRYRVVKRDDFIASIPRSAEPSTILSETAFYRQPLFYRYLVHYENRMTKNDTFYICGLSDDYGCRNTHKSFNMADHFSYFSIDREKFIKNRCPRDEIFAL
ncbi:Triacylglycerol lipase [Trichostrongylus colubriformis]|uniref:Triacylglycerol lipase n=1 Tax=Trichostrongylus colubriformis TaxID=6319 RepID=A0AAN8J3R9_TRICO